MKLRALSRQPSRHFLSHRAACDRSHDMALEQERYVNLIADDGSEHRILAASLCSVSSVWSERFQISTATLDVKSYEQGMPAEKVEAFIGVCTLFSTNPTMPSLLARARHGSIEAYTTVHRLCSSLDLIHKYDCKGLAKLVAHLVDYYFPRCTLTESRLDATSTILPVSRWLTQSHLNYILRSQELFDSCMMLNESATALLAHALTTGLQWSSCTRYANGLHFWHGRVAVVDIATPRNGAAANGGASAPAAQRDQEELASMRSTHGSTAGASDLSSTSAYTEIHASSQPNAIHRQSYDPVSASLHVFFEPLVLERGRLTMSTMAKVLSLMSPTGSIHVAGRAEDRSDLRCDDADQYDLQPQ